MAFDQFDSRNPQLEEFTKTPSDLFTHILDCVHDSGLPHEEIDMVHSWRVKVCHIEDEDVYLEIDGESNSFTVQGFHCKKFVMDFTGITKKNSFAVTPELIKSFLTVLDFKLA